MANALAASLSPYLRQHAQNPVDWREWNADAFAEARRRDVPILLSVGYAACHWCHVMAHESFENAEVASVLNAGFVNIKVDREERPDVDAVYMNVTQALTGHGGWPMTVFLTPDGHPIYAGTYFPREQFLHVARSIAEIWRSDRDHATSTGQNIVDALAGPTRGTGRGSSARTLSSDELAGAVRALRREFDDARGGFGGAPKFPPSMTLEHLLRHHARTGDPDAWAMAVRTGEAMARGGMYDQLDGGFARYSVDADWVVPHFEKMLYDNAQLLRVYVHLAQRGDVLARRIALETGEFLVNRLLTDEGGFASSLDADADGVEGTTYVWTPAELAQVLGDVDAERAARLLGVTQQGTFEGGASTLQLRRDPADVFTADELGVSSQAWWGDVRQRLREARDRRPQPARDDKVVTAWNGLAVAALAEAGCVLDRQDWVHAAERAAHHVVQTHLVDGRLRRTSLGGRVSSALGGADDYGAFAEGLLVLHQATGAASWLTSAVALLEAAERLFVVDEAADEGAHAWVYDTGSDAEALFTRPTSTGDNAEPSGASALASAWVMAFALTGETAYRELAERCLAQLSDVARQAPRFAGWALAASEALETGPLQVAIVVPEGADADLLREFRDVVWRSPSPGLVRVVGPPDAPGIPLLANRPTADGTITAYVCRGFVCDAPVTEPSELAHLLA